MTQTALDRIKAYKLDEIAADKAAKPLEAVEAEAKAASAPRGFANALMRASREGYGLIAEIKKASPSNKSRFSDVAFRLQTTSSPDTAESGAAYSGDRSDKMSVVAMGEASRASESVQKLASCFYRCSDGLGVGVCDPETKWRGGR